MKLADHPRGYAREVSSSTVQNSSAFQPQRDNKKKQNKTRIIYKALGSWGEPEQSPRWEPRCKPAKHCKHGDPHAPHAAVLLRLLNDASRAMQSTKIPGSRLRPPPAADALESVGFVSKGDKKYVWCEGESPRAVLTGLPGYRAIKHSKSTMT